MASYRSAEFPLFPPFNCLSHTTPHSISFIALKLITAKGLTVGSAKDPSGGLGGEGAGLHRADGQHRWSTNKMRNNLHGIESD